jgi:cytochrome c
MDHSTESMGAARRRLEASQAKLIPLLLAVLMGIASPAIAAELTDQQARSFLNAKGCNACHAVEQVHLAPSFRTISLRYAGAPSDAVDDLVQKIIYGGAGNWGVVPMISNPKITPTEAQAIASWIILLGNRAVDVGPQGK